MQQVVAEHPVFIAAVSMCRAIVSVTVDTIDTIVSVTVTDSASIDQSLFYSCRQDRLSTLLQQVVAEHCVSVAAVSMCCHSIGQSLFQ